MNDFVLRGFCQKCELSITWDSFNKQKDPNSIFAYCPKSLSKGISVACEPVYFLSPKQIRKIEESKEYDSWLSNRTTLEHFRGQTNTGFFANEQPFLVASILSKEDKKHD